MRRRTFMQACALGAGCLAAGAVAGGGGPVSLRHYDRVRLKDSEGVPLAASDLAPKTNYVFHYPYITTPCFLLRLDRPMAPQQLADKEGRPYLWQGGAGPDRTLVAYSAICAHRMAHPTPSVSYISYRPEVTDLGSGSGVIACCAEHSVYDPCTGASVLSGPADQPLATVLLEHDPKSDGLYAVGTLGGEMFNRYFDEYWERLRLEARGRDPDVRVVDDCRVQPLETYSRNIIRCAAAQSDPS